VSFAIGEYEDEFLCDVVPSKTKYLLGFHDNNNVKQSKTNAPTHTHFHLEIVKSLLNILNELLHMLKWVKIKS